MCCVNDIGIQAVAECLAKSTSEKTQDSAKLLIQELATVGDIL